MPGTPSTTSSRCGATAGPIQIRALACCGPVRHGPRHWRRPRRHHPAALAFIGIGQLVTRHPDLVRILAIAAASLVIFEALVAWCRDRLPTNHVDATSPRAVLTGLLLTLPNPGALSAWVAVAASLWPSASLAEALTLAAGVGIGSALWFMLLGYLVSRVPREHRALQIIPRAALVAFLAIAAIGLVRVL